MLVRKRIGSPRRNGQSSGSGFAVPESGGMRSRRHGRCESMGTPRSKHIRWSIWRSSHRHTRQSSSNLRWWRAGRLDHTIQRQSCASSPVVGHDQRVRPSTDLLGLTVGGCCRPDAGCGQVPAVTPTGSTLARTSACPSTALRTHPVSADLPLESRSCGGQRIAWDVLVDMDRLSMLAQVIETGKSPGTVTLKWTLPGMFANVASQMFTPGKTQIARWKLGAVEPLALFLLGWRSSVIVMMPIFQLMIRGIVISLHIMM